MNRVILSAVVAACAWGARAVEVSTVPEGKVCALSFTYDDGPATHYTHAFPLHKKYGFPGTFLIITSRVEDDADANRPHKNVSWRELKEMSDAVWLRVAPDEAVSVNGGSVRPNAYGGIRARVGDVIVSDGK